MLTSVIHAVYRYNFNEPSYSNVYESYTAENSHLLREYMLYVIIKHVRWMRKYGIITQSVFNEFQLTSELSPSETQSSELAAYIKQKQK